MDFERVAISAFVIGHLGITILWCLPRCELRTRTFPVTRRYILPLGLCQLWTMFAPDPVVGETVTLEAEVTDFEGGLRHVFAFPKLADYTVWQGIPRFRYSKYAANLADNEFDPPRKFAARHVLRQLRLPADSYPVEVHLLYQLRMTPPPGSRFPIQ